MAAIKRIFGDISRPMTGPKAFNFYKLVWPLCIFTTAYLAADISNQVLRRQLSFNSKGQLADTEPYKPPKRRSLLSIMRQEADQGGPANGANPAATVSNLHYKLIGTVVGKGRPSLAFFEDPKKKKQFLARVGEALEEGVVLKLVEKGSVILSVLGREVSLAVVYENRRGKSYTTSAPDLSSSSVSAGEGSILTRREVEDAVKNLNVVMTQARVIPYFVGGESQGYRVFSIRPGSIYTKLGLKNGDVIQRVNDVELNSPEKAYYLFQQLRNQPKITVDIIRRGRKMSIPIEVR